MQPFYTDLTGEYVYANDIPKETIKDIMEGHQMLSKKLPPDPNMIELWKQIRNVELDSNPYTDDILEGDRCFIYIKFYRAIGFQKTFVSKKYYGYITLLDMRINERISDLWRFKEGYFLDLTSNSYIRRYSYIEKSDYEIELIKIHLGIYFVYDMEKDHKLLERSLERITDGISELSDWVLRKIGAFCRNEKFDFKMYYENDKDLIYDDKFKSVLLNVLYSNYQHTGLKYEPNQWDLCMIPDIIIKRFNDDESLTKMQDLFNESNEAFEHLIVDSHSSSVPSLQEINRGDELRLNNAKEEIKIKEDKRLAKEEQEKRLKKREREEYLKHLKKQILELN